MRARAETGQASAQTQLGDCLLDSSDFTTAVLWYQRAALQDDVEAQLALAACMMSGRGTPKDPIAAATLLRKAADLIETNQRLEEMSRPPSATGLTGPPERTEERITAAHQLAPAASSAQVRSIPRPGSAADATSLVQTDRPRIERVDTLLVAEPMLESARFEPRAHPNTP